MTQGEAFSADRGLSGDFVIPMHTVIEFLPCLGGSWQEQRFAMPAGGEDCNLVPAPVTAGSCPPRSPPRDPKVDAAAVTVPGPPTATSSSPPI
jgi:hypothetical protein